jgi:hypothetical protein
MWKNKGKKTRTALKEPYLPFGCGPCLHWPVGYKKPLFISYAISGTKELQLLGEIQSTLSRSSKR